MFKPSARVGKTMRNAGAFILVLLASISFSAVSSGHEPKEFTVLLTDQGINPANIPEGTLVETDYLFLYNVDKRTECRETPRVMAVLTDLTISLLHGLAVSARRTKTALTWTNPA